MKYKVDELDGALLDAAVAKACGLVATQGGWYRDPSPEEEATRLFVSQANFRPSSDWQVGGVIIEGERIAVMPREDGAPWRAVLWLPPTNLVMKYGAGPTPLIAAMRAYASSKLGPEVELP